MVAQVNVGCKGRVEQITLNNFALSEDRGPWLVFRSSSSTAHKCGDTRFIAADATIAVPRHQARVDYQGVLLAPAVNAQLQCFSRTGWTQGPCMNAYLTQ